MYSTQLYIVQCREILDKKGEVKKFLDRLICLFIIYFVGTGGFGYKTMVFRMYHDLGAQWPHYKPPWFKRKKSEANKHLRKLYFLLTCFEKSFKLTMLKRLCNMCVLCSTFFMIQVLYLYLLGPLNIQDSLLSRICRLMNGVECSASFTLHWFIFPLIKHNV